MQDKELEKLQENYYQTMDSFDDKREGKILVLGIGNYLLGDEGVGVHAIHTLAKTKLPDNVDIVDGATGSFDLLPIMGSYDKVILIDATMDDKKIGSINVLYPRYSSDFPIALSSHDVGLKDLLDALELKGDMPKLILITITIKDILAMKIELHESVEAALPEVAKTVVKLTEKINKGELLN